MTISDRPWAGSTARRARVSADEVERHLLPGPRLASDPLGLELRSAPALHGAPIRWRSAVRRSSRAAVWVPRLVLLANDLVAFAIAIQLVGHGIGYRTVALLAAIVVVFWNGDLYRPRLALSVLDEAPGIIARAFAAGALLVVLTGLDDGVAGMAQFRTAAFFAGLSLVGRFACYVGIRTARRRGKLQQRTLLLGAGAVTATLAGNLLTHPQLGLRPVGMLDDDPMLPPDERPVPLLGGYGNLPEATLSRGVDVVIVTYGSLSEPSVVALLRESDRLACDILFVPRFYELHAVTRDTEVLWGMPVVRLRRSAYRSSSWTAKRVSDIVISALALLLMAPVLLVCALLSRLETGRVVFRQTRIGVDGQPFELLKFCSLRPVGDFESATRWNIAADKRLGPCGKLLRRTSLDELPQLWNVFRGDMSLVGPRPERPYFVDEFTRKYPWYSARHRVPVGLTGWAQVHGLRGDTSIGDRASFDNFYIENWSLWGDIKIMMRTVIQVLRGSGG